MNKVYAVVVVLSGATVMLASVAGVPIHWGLGIAVFLWSLKFAALEASDDHTP